MKKSDAKPMLQRHPIITTIIPTYRRPRLLMRAVLSVLNQSYPHVRVLILDNASGDETAHSVFDIAQRDSRVTYQCHQKNIGSNPNFNYGLRHVETPLFSLLCDDDLLTPDFYKNAMECFIRFPQAMLVCMPTMIITTDNLVCAEPIMPRVPRFYAAGEAFDDAIADSTIDLTWTGTVYKKEVPEQIGYINEKADFADKGFNVRSVARLPIVIYPYVGGILMAHKDSGSSRVEPIGNIRIRYREQLIADIINDANIPQEIKARASKLFHIDNSMKTGLMQLLRALGNDNTAYARKVARGAAELGKFGYVRLFTTIIALYRYSLIGRPLLRILIELRRRVLEKRYEKTSVNYREQIEYVRELNTKVGLNERS